MATVGDQLTTPEPSWKRYMAVNMYNKSAAIEFSSDWAPNGSNDMTTAVLNGEYKVDFIGSKLRILVFSYSNRSDMSISLDGGEEVIFKGSLSGTSQRRTTLAYTIEGLPFVRHSVIVKNLKTGGGIGTIDAIDIDIEGRLLHPREVIDIKELDVGKRIRCHYHAFVNNKQGVFSNLGREEYINGIDEFLSPTPIDKPDGDFYFIMLDTWNSKKIVVADRNIQSGISWDTLNNGGLVFGIGLKNYKHLALRYLPSRVIYVDDSIGDDVNGGGSIDKPFKTVQKAISDSYDGDIIFAKAGTYDVTRIAGEYDSGGLSDEGKALTFIGEKGKTIFLCDGTKHTKRDTHAIMFINGLTTAHNIIFDHKVGNRLGNYQTSITGAGGVPVLGSVYNCVIKSDSPTPSMTYSNNGASTIKFINCAFIVNTNFVVSYSGASFTRINCATNKNFYSEGKSNMTNLQVATFDSDHRITSDGWAGKGTGINFDDTVANIGIYGGYYGWDYEYDILELNTGTGLSLRLLSGGVTGTNGGSSSDKNNEWDKYIVNSDLNGTIIPGDNNVWNWNNNFGSWTSTTPSTSSTNRIKRGSNVGNSAWYSDTASSVVNQYSCYRPVLEIEKLTDFKILIQEGNFIKKWADDQWITIAEEPFEESLFDQVEEGLPPVEAFNQLADRFEIYVQTELSYTEDELSIKAIPKAVIVTPTKDISIRSVETIDSFTLNINMNGQGVVKIAVSFDKGNTWHTRKNNAWSEISLEVSTMQIDGMDPTTLNAITSTEWSQLRGASETIRFAYLLSMENETDILEVQDLVSQMDMKGTWKKAVHGSHYDYEYPNNDELLVTIFEGGDYKINY